MREVVVSALISLLTLVSGTAFPDTAKIGALVVDDATDEPIENVHVTANFMMNNGWLAWKGGASPNIKRVLTDKRGRCQAMGRTNVGKAGCYVRSAPNGYYVPALGDGYTFEHKNLFGVWQPDNLVVTIRLQRVEHPVPLFVKQLGRNRHGIAKEMFPKGCDLLFLDLMVGDWLPPAGNGMVADVEFRRFPREDQGEGEVDGIKGRSYRDKMSVRFLGDGNGLVEMPIKPEDGLWIRKAPEEGFKGEYLCWEERGKDLQLKESYDKHRCFCFRIRTQWDNDGCIVRAYYGKIYGDISAPCLAGNVRSFVPIAGVCMRYYLNPVSLDRNLEWNMKNLCPNPGDLHGVMP